MNDQDQVTDAEIECVFELDRDATDGPWNDQPRHNGCGLLASDGGPVGWIETASWAGTTSGHRSIQDANANAALIAHYRNVAPRIARDLVEARAEVGRLREERDEALARAEKAEAEVKRLRGLLGRAFEEASSDHGWAPSTHAEIIEALKARDAE